VKYPPVSPKDILHTVYHPQGIDAASTIANADGRPMPLVDGGKVVNSGINRNNEKITPAGRAGVPVVDRDFAAESEPERSAGWFFLFSDRRGAGARVIWSPLRP
jgi:hypothetical protein